MKPANPQPPATGESDLIGGILEDAEAEAQRILNEAHKSAALRAETTRSQATAILDEARRSAAQQAETIRRQMADKIRMHQRRAALQAQEEVLSQVIEGAQTHFAAQITMPAYRETLIGWIVEAALGLDVLSASINASAAERPLLDADLLRTATATIKELTGRSVVLQVSTQPPTMLQGILLQTTEGNVEFNNYLATRLVRYQSKIRRTVHAEIFG